MGSYRVSIIVPTYNRAHYIKECLESLFAQTVSAYEIIVVDDGSEDGTAALLSEYGERIRYVRKENGGKPSAVNLALTLIQGELVWLFDDDDVALPDAIEKRVATLKSCPGAGFVYSPHYLGTDDANGRIVRGRLHDSPAYDGGRFLYELMKGCFFHLGSALVRSELYREVGPFDPRLLSSEDYDMQIRIACLAGAAYCSSPTFIFRQHAGIRGAKSIRYGGAARTEVFRRHDRLVGLKLRESLPLGDYRVPRSVVLESQDGVRDALLSRMVVMGSKGCVPEMLDDLIDALATLGDRGRLNPEETQRIRESVATGYAYRACREDWSGFLSRCKGLSRYTAGRQALRSLARSFIGIAKSYPGSFRDRSVSLRAALFLMQAAYS